MICSLLSIISVGLLSQNDVQQYLIPQKTAMVAQFDLKEARQSGYFDEDLQQGFDRLLKSNDQIQQLSEMLEFDPSKKLLGFTVCAGGERSQDGSFVLIISGEFPYEKFQASLAKMADEGQLSTLDVNDLPVYFNHRERRAMYFGVIDAGTLIASPSKKWLEDSIQGLTDLRKPTEELLGRTKWLTSESHVAVRLSGLFPEDARQRIGRNPQFKAIAEKLIGYNAVVQLGDRPRIRVRLSMTSDEAVDQAATLFKTLIGFGKAALANSTRQDLAQLLEDLEIELEGEHLIFDVRMTRELFQQIINNNREQRDDFRRRRQEREKARREQS